MDLLEFQELLDILQNGDESEVVEAKKSADKVGESALETISAFCNEPDLGGGYLVLGLQKNESSLTNRYSVVGVSDPDKIQNELVTLCRQKFNKPIRPIVKVVFYQDNPVIVAFIPEAETYEKPIFIKSRGIDRGAFRRIGPSDQLCTREDLDLMSRYRSEKKFDETTINNCSWNDFDLKAIEAYRQYRREVNANAKELKRSDKDLMISLGAALDWKAELKPTVAGLLLFGTEIAIRRLFPISARIDYTIVEGKEWVSNPEKRYSHCYEFREALILTIPRLITHIMKDIPNAFSMQPGGIFRKDIPLIPDIVIREAVCNAVMHRNYNIGQPVQIIRYANRIEFQNPGYSLKPENQLGMPGSISRNEKIAGVLHDLNIAETKGTGIRTMQECMKESNLSVPLFESDRAGNKFILTLLSHHFFNENDIQWLKRLNKFNLSPEEARALLLVREMGAITNADFRNINCVDTLNASVSLRKLRDCGLVEAKGKSSQTYYVPGEILADNDTPNSSITILSTELTLDTDTLSTELTLCTNTLSTELTLCTNTLSTELITLTIDALHLPLDVKEEIESLGSRIMPNKAKHLVLRICNVKSFKLSELARLLKRNDHYVRKHYLMPLIKSGELEYIFPNQPNHPGQAYQTKQQLTE